MVQPYRQTTTWTTRTINTSHAYHPDTLVVCIWRDGGDTCAADNNIVEPRRRTAKHISPIARTTQTLSDASQSKPPESVACPLDCETPLEEY